MKRKWNIMCKVSGGVTGTRQSLFKEMDHVRVFDDLEYAKEVAHDLEAKMNGPHATASFSYTPIAVE